MRVRNTNWILGVPRDKDTDIASFKTPDVRRVLVTGPYKGDGLQNPHLCEDIQPLGLSEGQSDAVVAFLGSLTSSD